MHMLGILAAAEILNKAAADNSSNSYLKNVMKFIILILNNGKQQTTNWYSRKVNRFPEVNSKEKAIRNCQKNRKNLNLALQFSRHEFSSREKKNSVILTIPFAAVNLIFNENSKIIRISMKCTIVI